MGGGRRASSRSFGPPTGTVFPSALMRAFAFENAPAPGVFSQGMERLRRLRHRGADGSLRKLSETKVEQSFNERVFCKVFGYRSLFSSRGGPYDLLPKQTQPAGPRGNRSNDFSLGFFGPDREASRATVELKTFGQDLDQKQRNRRNRCAVEQAFDFADRKACKWIIVSDFDELRLYHASDTRLCERIWLSRIATRHEFDRAYSLLGRRTLLAQGPESRSPLEKLLDRNEKGDSMVKPKDGRLRLVQQARRAPPASPDSDERLYWQRPVHWGSLSDALIAASGLTGNRWPAPDGLRPRLADDRLTWGKGNERTLEMTRTGELTITEHTEGERTISPEWLFNRMWWFVAFTAETFAHKGNDPEKELLGQGALFEWRLEDLEPDGAWDIERGVQGCSQRTKVTIVSRAEWVASPTIEIAFRGQRSDRVARRIVASLRDLLFAFENDGSEVAPDVDEEYLVKLLSGNQTFLKALHLDDEAPG